MKIYLSLNPKKKGGGSNTFSYLFKKYAKRCGHKIVNNIRKADLAIIIAHFGNLDEIQDAQKTGCFVIHRIDEYFLSTPSKKHQKIKKINLLANVTVFQSNYVLKNAMTYLKPSNHTVIYNGGSCSQFLSDDSNNRKFIGHVTWGIADKKRLDLLAEFIKSHPGEKFLLVGRHGFSDIFLDYDNVSIHPPATRKKISKYYRKMKMLYFPSEKDPCPNTVIESILSGVPVCYNPEGGAQELVNDCGTTLDRAEVMLKNLEKYRERCFSRDDLCFENTFKQYLSLYKKY